jgi:hypothetical protein
MKEHTISTPTGRRILTDIGKGFCVVRSAFGASVNDAKERLHFHRGMEVHASPDGVFIGPRQLWSIVVGMAANRKAPITAKEAGEMLFAVPTDVHTAIAELMAAADPADEYWQAMKSNGWYDATTRTAHHIQR